MSVPDGDVNGAGDAGAVGGQHQAAVGVRTAQLLHVLAQSGAQAPLVLGPDPRRQSEGVGRLAGHAELALVQRRADVLAGLARQGQLEVVDGGRAVHRHGLDQPLVNPVDEVRTAARLDDVSAQGGDDRASLGVRPRQVEAHAAHAVAGQLARQRIQPFIDGGPRRQRLAQVLAEHLRRPRFQVVRLQAVQIERLLVGSWRRSGHGWLL